MNGLDFFYLLYDLVTNISENPYLLEGRAFPLPALAESQVCIQKTTGALMADNSALPPPHTGLPQWSGGTQADYLCDLLPLQVGFELSCLISVFIAHVCTRLLRMDLKRDIKKMNGQLKWWLRRTYMYQGSIYFHLKLQIAFPLVET